MPPAALRARFSRRWLPQLAAGPAAAALLATATAQSGSEGFSRNSFPDAPPAPRPLELVPIFFPPIPPPLDRLPARGATQASRFSAPADLSNYLTEFFYPLLGSRIATKALSDKQRAQLDSYRTAKLALQNELRAELQKLRGIEPPARAEALAALSRRQTPKIAELEKTAEDIRRELNGSDYNWNTFRQWHLSDKERRGYSPVEIAQVMRATAYYQNNLHPAQRRLLREVSIELAFAAENTTAATAAQPFVFFPPEPARVIFPEDMSAEVASKLASYQTKRSALKKELYDTVYANDGGAFGFLRSNPLKALAEKQAGRFAELETLAEEIRRGLTALPEARLERSPLPPHLDARVTAMIQRYQVTQKASAAKADAILVRAKDLPMQANYRFEGDGMKFIVVPTRGARGPTPGGRGPAGGASARIDEVRTQLSAVAEDYGRTIADLLNERESIRQEIATSLGLAKAEEIERALVAAMRVAGQKENANSFSDYRVAVFEPGLSPEQRRLLFDSVVQQFELTLPRGEPQPTLRANSW